MTANVRTALAFAVFVLQPVTSWAVPLVLGPPGSPSFIDFRLEVATRLTLVPGDTGFLFARLTNLGNVDATFPVYDAANDVGGFAWDFFSPGLVISGFSQTGGGPTGLVTSTEGLVDPLTFNPNASFVFGHPAAFFHLSNVNIAPGDTLEFAIRSLIVSPTASQGISFEYDVNNFLLTFCATNVTNICGRWDSVGVGWDVRSTVTVGATFSNGNFQSVPLTLTHVPHTNVPDQTDTLILLALGIGAVLTAKRATAVMDGVH